jgi:hypothetical protein
VFDVHKIWLYLGILKGEGASCEGWSEEEWFARSVKVYWKRDAHILLQIKSFRIPTGNYSYIYGHEFLQILSTCTSVYLTTAIDHILRIELPPTWLLKNVELWWRSGVKFLNITWKYGYRIAWLNLAAKLGIIVGKVREIKKGQMNV